MAVLSLLKQTNLMAQLLLFDCVPSHYDAGAWFDWSQKIFVLFKFLSRPNKKFGTPGQKFSLSFVIRAATMMTIMTTTTTTTTTIMTTAMIGDIVVRNNGAGSVEREVGRRRRRSRRCSPLFFGSYKLSRQIFGLFWFRNFFFWDRLRFCFGRRRRWNRKTVVGRFFRYEVTSRRPSSVFFFYFFGILSFLFFSLYLAFRHFT